MLIRDLPSANDEVNDLAALILPTFDARVGNLVASFEHLARAEQPDEDALFAKLRNLAYEIVSADAAPSSASVHELL